MYAYADDVNFVMIEADEVREEAHREQQQQDEMMIECQCITCRAYQLEEHLPRYFAEYGMQMNIGKTTHAEFKMGNSTEVELTIVGNNVSGKHECAARIQSANSAFNSMQRIWFRNIIKRRDEDEAILQLRAVTNAVQCRGKRIHKSRAGQIGCSS